MQTAMWKPNAAKAGGRITLDMDKSWAAVLAAAGSGTPGTIKDRLLSEDKSQRYKQLSDAIAVIDRDHPSPPLTIDGWLNRIEFKRQLLPHSTVHDIKWHGSAEIPLGYFELHVTKRR
jgi:hypothetical protein